MLTANHSPAIRAGDESGVFRPVAARLPALMAAGAAALGVVLALALVVRGAADGVTFAAFASYVVAAALLMLAGVAGYWAACLWNLRYEVTGGALVIVWGLTRQVIPLTNMERVVRGRSLALPRVRGLALPGWACHVGRARVSRLGEALIYSTHRAPADLLYLVTPTGAYGISPADSRGLIQALQTGMAGATTSVRQELRRDPLAALPVWTDRIALGAATVSAFLALAVVGIVFARYTGTPARTVIPFPDGDHIAGKRALLGIPLTAVAILLMDVLGAFALHHLVRPIAYLLLLGGLFAQLLLVVAALTAS